MISRLPEGSDWQTACAWIAALAGVGAAASVAWGLGGRVHPHVDRHLHPGAYLPPGTPWPPPPPLSVRFTLAEHLALWAFVVASVVFLVSASVIVGGDCTGACRSDPPAMTVPLASGAAAVLLAVWLLRHHGRALRDAARTTGASSTG